MSSGRGGNKIATVAMHDLGFMRKQYSDYSKLGQVQELRIDGYDKFKVVRSGVDPSCTKFNFELFIPEVKMGSRQRDVLGNRFYMETVEKSAYTCSR